MISIVVGHVVHVTILVYIFMLYLSFIKTTCDTAVGKEVSCLIHSKFNHCHRVFAVKHVNKFTLQYIMAIYRKLNSLVYGKGNFSTFLICYQSKLTNCQALSLTFVCLFFLVTFCLFLYFYLYSLFCNSCMVISLSMLTSRFTVNNTDQTLYIHCTLSFRRKSSLLNSKYFDF